ncbi:hypothetical protein GRI97_14545 [Altererythrobacter xixiisoli]|uniref:Uncharacterized protein n=1 Tax=Croceibacterium xixiisoli TaxID=1476466 RepID=A0A6I4TYM6_9SPHN|nr:hypothetical protein [Croceibacterium xixiisoli]MXP00210.1 hypothetical protein [Croceibacterium xixiisoli]
MNIDITHIEEREMPRIRIAAAALMLALLGACTGPAPSSIEAFALAQLA